MTLPQRWYRLASVTLMLVSSGDIGCTGGKGAPSAADGEGEPDSGRDSGAGAGPGRIHLVYMGSASSGDVGRDDDPHLIYTATSDDGVNFKEDGLIFTSEDRNDPDIFPAATGFGLLTSNGPTLNYATSDTLAGTFTEGTELSWRGGGGSSTLSINGVQQVFFCGFGAIDVSPLELDPPALGTPAHALSNPHGAGFICDPNVVKFGEADYRMYYHWTPELSALPYRHIVYGASSTDGLNFTAIDEAIYEQASVPGAVVREGVIYLYAVDGEGGGHPDDDSGHKDGDSGKDDPPSGLIVGISADGGGTWDFQKVLFENAAMPQAYDPDPILAP